MIPLFFYRASAPRRGHYIVFIVWRQRPVKGQGGGPFLLIDPDYPSSG